jgi:hypothetical protein
MDKRIYVIIIALLVISGAALAQGPTLTYANSGLAVGDAYNTFAADTTGVLPGPAGAGQSWNFGSLSIGVAANQSCLNPSGTPYGSSFPAATVATNSGSTSYGYFKINTSEYSLLGTGSPSYIMIYSDPQKILTYPFSYGSVLNDNIVASYTVGGTAVTRTGASHSNADAWGTLTLPSGNYPNVVRLKLTQALKDSSSLFVATYAITSYLWYDGTHKTPLLNVYFMAQTVLGNTTYTKAVYVADYAAGIPVNNTEDADISLYPNPASKQVTVSYNSSEGKQSQISLLDIQGRCVLKTYNMPVAGQHDFILDISALPQGVYFMRIASGIETATRKLIVY